MVYAFGDHELEVDIAYLGMLVCRDLNIDSVAPFESLFELIFVRNRKMFERLAFFSIGNEEEAKDIVSRTLRKLPQKQREIFIKNRVEGLSYKETAEALGISYKAVDKGLQSTMKILKMELGEYLPIFFILLNMIKRF